MAEGRGLHSGVKPRHYIYLQAGGGEANTITSPVADIRRKDKIGAAGLFSLGYEMTYRNFFLDAGVAADYTYTSQWIEQFTESRSALDFEGEALQYEYKYSKLTEKQQVLYVGIPIQLGYWVHPYVYVGLGGKVGLAMLSTYNTTADMFTQGVYARFYEPIREQEQYGYYPLSIYQYQPEGKQTIAATLPRVSVSAEVGGKIPLRAKRVRMRGGLYVEYGLPIGAITQKSIGDYAAVDMNPLTQNQTDLRNNLKLNSVLDSNKFTRAYMNLSVGVRLTVSFDVTIDHSPCNCQE